MCKKRIFDIERRQYTLCSNISRDIVNHPKLSDGTLKKRLTMDRYLEGLV